ncbi:hypothetical protein [Caulobacter sp. S45]|jgi:hypothetical protein|uniref:hypothetical protein n=1 Tax=Caulobacter sp. S45 TaxID=1641861 RepID=UPI00131E9C03|nr:hypothetical protein [Caulobacter sp. S45]
MVHDVQAIREDLAFMRALAQEGRRAPLLIGRSLLVAGLVFALASLVCWAIAARMLALPQWSQIWVWVVAVGLYVPYAWFRACQRDGIRPGATAVTNRAVQAVWRGLGYAMLALFAAFWIVAVETRSYAVFDIYPSVMIAFYGAAWTVAAAMSELKWIGRVAAGCFLAAVVIGFAAPSLLAFPATALALLLLVALPGWLLMRGEPSNVV